MAGRVFISYARVDAIYAAQLAAYLTNVGIEVWLDGDLELGDRWVSAIRQQVETCAVVVVVVTPAAGDSHWVQNELIYAQQFGKPIMPVLLAGKPIFGLANLQHEDVAGGRMPSDRFIRQLRERLRVPALPAATSLTIGTPATVATLRARWWLPTGLWGEFVGLFDSEGGEGAMFGFVLAMIIALLIPVLPPLLVGLAAGTFWGWFTLVAEMAVVLLPFWLRARRRDVTFSAHGITLGHGRWATVIAWSEFVRTQVRDGKLVAVTEPGSALSLRRQMRGKYVEAYGGFVVAEAERLGVTPYELAAAAARFAPIHG